MIEVRSLEKRYGEVHATRGISFAIEQGEAFGLLGPNGAGKTTTILMMVGALRPDAGEVLVDGKSDPTQAAVRRCVGVAPQGLAIYDELTAEENLAFFGRLYGLSGRQLHERIDWGLEFAGLQERRSDRAGKYSGGMKRRVLIGKALTHEPVILFLDEPTAGVDVELRKEMWALARRLRESGVTIILTTHYIEEAEAIADRVGVINHGELLLLDDKDALMHKLGKRQLIIELEASLQVLPEVLEPWGLDLSANGSVLTYTYDPHKTRTGINELLQALRDAELAIKDVHTTKTSLEEIFVSLVKAKT